MARNKTFKLSDEVEKVSVDFRPYGSFSGTIPEPSQQQMNAWTVGMAQLAAENAFDGDPNDVAEITRYMAEMDEDKLNEQAEQTAELYSELCSGEPSKDQILELPPRVRQKFLGHITGVFNPEKSAPAGQS